MYTCGYCLWFGPANDFEVDHIIPRIRGGSEDASNKQIICSGCNREKADKTHIEYLAYRIAMGTKQTEGQLRIKYLCLMNLISFKDI